MKNILLVLLLEGCIDRPLDDGASIVIDGSAFSVDDTGFSADYHGRLGDELIHLVLRAECKADTLTLCVEATDLYLQGQRFENCAWTASEPGEVVDVPLDSSVIYNERSPVTFHVAGAAAIGGIDITVRATGIR